MAFKRMEGFAGSVPQKFIDNNIQKCPICGATNPHWSIDMKMGLINRYLFQCEECKCILSASVPDVTGISRTPLTTLGIAKALGGKKMNVIYMKIDDVGTMKDKKNNEGKEITLEELNDMANKI